MQALCLVYVDDFMLACSDSTFGTQVFDGMYNLCEWRTTWESRVFTQSGARITQAYDKHTNTCGGFGTSFTDYVKAISPTSWPSHRRLNRKSRITSLELIQLRALNGQLLWLGLQSLPQLLAPLSLLVVQTPQATVDDTIFEVNNLATKGDSMGQHATQTPRSSFSCGSHVHRCWMDDSTSRKVTRETSGLHRKCRLVARERTKRVSHILAFESSETCGKVVICSRNSSSSWR